MNCSENKELLVGYIEELLDSHQNENVRQHLNECADCRKELEQIKALQNRLVANGADHNQNGLENAVMDRILREQAFRLRKSNQVKQHVNIWRIIMKSPFIKLAAAAAIVIAVLAGIYFVTGKPPAITCCAWAQIADRVEQFKTCIFRIHMVQTGGPQGIQNIDGDMYISSEYGNRMDAYMDGNLAMQAFVLPSEKVIISVMPQAKKYMRMLLTDDYMAKMKKQGQDPRDMIKGFMSGDYSELEVNTIDGVEVKGIKTVNPPAVRGIYDNFVGKLWVDVATELPVRLEFEAEMPAIGTQKMQMSMVMDEFEWEVEIEPGIFEPNIPADYSLMAEMTMPGMDEASAIKGLRLFAEVTNGKYPSNMNTMTVMQEATEAFKKKMMTDILDSNTKPADAEMENIIQKMMQKAMPMQGPSMFYNKLAQDGNDPAYYGKDVTVGDANAVLMRWKISDDTYRVIFGDLTAEDVTAEQLREMEEAVKQ